MLDLGYVGTIWTKSKRWPPTAGSTLDLAPFRTVDTERRQLITQTERLKAERNRASDEIVRPQEIGPGREAISGADEGSFREIKRDDERIAQLDEG